MRILTTLLLSLALAAQAIAQTSLRDLPADAQVGVLTHVQGNILRLDGQLVRLAPGGLIRAQNNLITVPAALPPDSLVKYKVDQNGDLSRVWVLTPDEAAQAAKSPPSSAPVSTSPEPSRSLDRVLPQGLPSPTQPSVPTQPN